MLKCSPETAAAMLTCDVGHVTDRWRYCSWEMKYNQESSRKNVIENSDVIKTLELIEQIKRDDRNISETFMTTKHNNKSYWLTTDLKTTRHTQESIIMFNNNDFIIIYYNRCFLRNATITINHIIIQANK